MQWFGPLNVIRRSPPWQKVGVPTTRVVSGIGGKLGENNVALVAGGVAFYAFLSIFPAIACALMLWGLFTTETELRSYLDLLSAVVPESAFTLISNQMIRIADSQTTGLSWGAVLSLGLALWSSSRAVNALLSAVAVTYDRHKKRGFVTQNLLALGFTGGGIVFALLSLAAIGAVPPIIDALQLGSFIEAGLRIVRWIAVLSLFLGGIYAFYRIARPHGVRHADLRTRPVLPGTIVAGTIWLAASVGFSFYLGNFADYNETFGSLGAAVALLMWLWLSAFAVCIGAETNGVIGRDRKDTAQSAS
ncbi:YihY/virulence factor BrkB family protein [Henriciella sp.]|uniref:YihY/virulence factor BrkB family protein n=1 Tax=Henriciella sp. TaxID=1968823 RepID=UPI00260B6688|nr:YihY/virulence factor BrkB family protein [Henriciella sp.]